MRKADQRSVNEAVEEMKQLDRDARKTGLSKEKAKKRKEEIKKYLKKQGVI